MAALVTGGTGTIGRRLISVLPTPVKVTSRDPERAARTFPGQQIISWNGSSEIDPERLDGVDAVFHLAGEPLIEGRWNAEKKRQIRESRVEGTRAIVATMKKMTHKPRVFVSASAVGAYGSQGDTELTEASPPGNDFLAEVCRSWEAAAAQAESFGVRTVMLRIGLVLSRDGGALVRMLPAFRMGAGGRLGDGKQWMSWIHVADVAGLCLHARDREDLHGAINAVAPGPVTNAELTKALARVLHRPAVLPVPRAMLRIVFGEAAELLFASQRVLPERALASGYVFRFSDLATAFRDLLGGRS
jgi:uncharacterized protein